MAMKTPLRPAGSTERDYREDPVPGTASTLRASQSRRLCRGLRSGNTLAFKVHLQRDYKYPVAILTLLSVGKYNTRLPKLAEIAAKQERVATVYKVALAYLHVAAAFHLRHSLQI